MTSHHNSNDPNGAGVSVLSPLVLHLPHDAADIPHDIRSTLLLAGDELRRELLRVTDWFTDELFALPANVAARIRFPVSRLVVDPERFVGSVASQAGHLSEDGRGSYALLADAAREGAVRVRRLLGVVAIDRPFWGALVPRQA